MEQFKKAYPLGSFAAKGYERDGELIGAAPVPSRAVWYTSYAARTKVDFLAPWDALIRGMVIQDNNAAQIFSFVWQFNFTIQVPKANMTSLGGNFYQLALPHFVLQKGKPLTISASVATNSWQAILDVEPADWIEHQLFF